MPRCPAFLVALLLAAGTVFGQDGDRGLLVPVPERLDSTAVTRIKGQVDAALSRPDERPAKVVFHFTPVDKDTERSDFGQCYDLAEAIGTKWKDVYTVAFVTRKASGHVVLPILCCNELVLGDSAALGPVAGPGDPPLGGVPQNAYLDLVGKAKPGQYAIVRRMLDPNVQLAKGTKDGGEFFVDLRERDKLPAGVTVTDTKLLAPVGTAGQFTAEQLKQFGLTKVRANTVAELAALYGLAPGTLRDDPLAGRPPVAYRYVLKDEVTVAAKESVVRSVREVVRHGGNLLFLQLECDGGDISAANDLAAELIKFQHPESGDGLRIVAFVPNHAANTAAVIALGCTEIVLSKRGQNGDAATEGVFGDFEGFFKQSGQNPAAVAGMLADLAREQGYNPLLAEGLANRDVEILQVQSKTDRRKRTFMTPEELQRQKADWESVGTVKRKGELLKLPAGRAKEFGFAKHVLDGADPAELYARYGVDPARVKEATPAWLDIFRNFLREPAVTAILVLVAFIGLILELKVPGTTVPGIVAALCFILVFWAWTGFSGQLAVLAGLLFLLGLILILLEVFVLPGFGVAGIIGIILMLGSLALVTVDKIPESGNDWMKFGGQVAKLMFLLIGAGVGAFLIARYLPKVPYANRMVLAPTAEREATDPTVLPGAAQAANLLGAIGVATTVLRPAGTVQFGDEFVDVVSDGGFIPPGTRVQVVEVEGTRIVVKEV